MKIQCPHCGKLVPINRMGGKPLDISAKDIGDALHAHSTVLAAALKLGCSREYIYQTLNNAGLTVKGVTG